MKPRSRAVALEKATARLHKDEKRIAHNWGPKDNVANVLRYLAKKLKFV